MKFGKLEKMVTAHADRKYEERAFSGWNCNGGADVFRNDLRDFKQDLINKFGSKNVDNIEVGEPKCFEKVFQYAREQLIDTIKL